MAVPTRIQTEAERLRDLLARQPRRHLIGGEWVTSADGATFDTIDPSTGKVLAAVAAGGAEDIDRAVRAARAAFQPDSPWRRLTPAERGKIIWKVGELIEAHALELATLESLDNGKTVNAALGYDIPTSYDHFYYMAGWTTKIEGATLPISAVYLPHKHYHAYTRREPIGVCGQITPWNFPLQMAAWKVAPALAAGCTIVLKPAEQTSLTALRLGELCQEAGVPDGVVNVVTGMGETAGAALAAHPGVDKVAFTGSTEVGKLLVRAAAGNLKRLTLELGGKSPHIILRDADLDAAAAKAAEAVYYNHGQMCTSGSRIYVEREAYDDVLSSIVDHAKGMRLGSGLDDDVDMGPLVSAEQLDRVSGYVDGGITAGAAALAGGKRRDTPGYFFEPTVLDGTAPDMKVRTEEIFGPVAITIPFGEDDVDLIRQANATSYGLASGIWTKDVARAHRLAERIEAGVVWINCYNVFDSAMPFGGYKESGWGRECSSQALNNYLETKSVVVSL